VARRGSAIWGGATLGLVVGLVLGFFIGSYWTTVLYAVLIGAASGVVANLLALPADILHRREMTRREHAARAASESLLDTSEDRRTVEEHLFETSEDYRAQAESLLQTSEDILRNISPADFEKTPDAYELIYMVEDGENWRAGYDSLESFYAAHETRHPDVRQYAARAGKFLDDREGVLRECSPADFETKPYAAIECIAAAHAIVDREVWRTGYDSLESFYGAHEARHPDIRVYAAVYRQGYAESARGDPSLALGRNIAQGIADRR
jgi:hypothetical protein